MEKKRFQVIAHNGPMQEVLQGFDSEEEAEIYRRSAEKTGHQNTAVWDKDTGEIFNSDRDPR